MSSSIDYFECPKCGNPSAYREQDNQTCEITCGCPNCNWNGTNDDDAQESLVDKLRKLSKKTMAMTLKSSLLMMAAVIIHLRCFMISKKSIHFYVWSI